MARKLLLLFILFFLPISLIFSQANANCSGAAPFCSENTYSFPMNVDAGSAESGPDYGCLGSEPNPAWYYMLVDTSGTIIIDIASIEMEDVDFICYGPFSGLTGICDSLTAGTTVDCSYSASPTETCVIPGAIVGEYYLLLLTNYSNNTSTVVFSQSNEGSPGAGSTNCNILNAIPGNNGPLCEGDTLELYVDPVPDATYSWTGPASFTSSISAPVIPNVTVANAGLYTCVVVDTVSLASDTVTTNVVIYTQPTASLVVSNPYCMGDAIVLDASGSTPLPGDLTFFFDLNNNGAYEINTPDSIYNATSSFAGAGNYTINMIVENAGGCSDTVTSLVQVYNNPTVGTFVLDPTICMYDMAQFTGSAFLFNGPGQSSIISNYEWDLDFNGTTDTSGSALTAVNHLFSSLGPHSVILTVTSDIGCETSDTIVVTVVDVPHGNIVAPAVCGNVAANFSFNSTGVPVTTYSWNFGDLTTTSDVSSAPAPSWNYGTPGFYTVTVIVGSADGCLDTMITLLNLNPLPSGTIANTAVCAGVDEIFNFDQTSADSITGYSWTFPGGVPGSSTDSVETVNFPFPGPTNVSVIVTNQYGCLDTVTVPFLVRTLPNPLFGVYPICISRFTFDPFSANPNADLDWNMGDGTLYPDRDTTLFNYIFTGPGDYNVNLTITDEFGCVNSHDSLVHVDDSLIFVMPNVLVQSSSMNNNQVDMEAKYPGFNLCMDYTYTVFDRWGVKVFQTHNDPYDPDLYCNHCFKGLSEGGSVLVPGVYYYVLEGNFNILKSGSITIFE